MLKTMMCAAVALACMGAAGLAQELRVTQSQQQTIAQNASSEQAQPVPSGFQPKVGEAVPLSVALHAMPSNVIKEIPTTADYKIAKLQNNDVLIVDPRNRHIVGIIMSPGTIGSGSRR